MRVLIVDDDDRRRAKISQCILEANIVQENQIFEADCIDSAKELLSNSYFDILILDVVLPKRSKETPDSKYGLSLLGQLTRSQVLNKPEKIIGVTAYIDDIQSYRQEFERYCFSVIEANPASEGWHTRLTETLAYTVSSKFTRALIDSNLDVVTVHGIRTFGGWQDRLRSLALLKAKGLTFHSYKYGYFSTLAFFLPFLRQREVRRLKKHFVTLFGSQPENRFMIYCHSFGTYLVVHALKEILQTSGKIPVRALVLSGSVLHRNFNWSEFGDAGVRIVNDCADRDYVLWISEALVLGTGMAGKTGFYGFQNGRFINRYFPGGHSSYFEGDAFMEKYWLPLLRTEEEVPFVDNRASSTVQHEILEKMIVGLGYIKPFLYISLFALLGFIVI